MMENHFKSPVYGLKRRLLHQNQGCNRGGDRPKGGDFLGEIPIFGRKYLNRLEFNVDGFGRKTRLSKPKIDDLLGVKLSPPIR